MVMVPLQLGVLGDRSPSSFLIFMMLMCRCFWTLDVPMSVMSGFVTANGDIEMRPVEIWKRYAKTWMTIDCVVIGSDWIEVLILAVGDDSSSAGVIRLGKIF